MHLFSPLMNSFSRCATTTLFTLCAAFAVTGCSSDYTPTKAEAGALAGGAIGAGLGAIVGSQVGSPGAGIAIGAASGAMVGGYVGSSVETMDERAIQQREILRRQEEELQRQKRELEDLQRQRVIDDRVSRIENVPAQPAVSERWAETSPPAPRFAEPGSGVDNGGSVGGLQERNLVTEEVPSPAAAPRSSRY